MTQPDDPRDRDLDDAYRDAAREQPSGDLDARILAAAHRAVHARPTRVRPWHERWRAPIAVAATIVLSVGLVLTIQREAPEAPLPTEAPKAPLPSDSPPRVDEPGASAAPVPTEPKPARPAVPVERGTGTAVPASPSPAPARRNAAGEKRPEATAVDNAVTPSPPFPATQPSAPRSPSAAPAPEMRREQQSGPGYAAPAPAPAAPLGRERSLEMERPARATRDADWAVEPRTPEAWVEEIRRLRAAGLAEEADRALAELRKRYPDFALPADLRN